MKARSGTKSIVVVVTVAMAFLTPVPGAAQVGDPHFNVDPTSEDVWGHEWLASASVDIVVTESDGSTVKGSDTVPTDGDGNFGTGFDPVVVDIVAGDWVYVMDGVATEGHQVTALEVTSVDEASNIVAGTAGDGTDVWVDVHGSSAGRTVAAGPGWSTDFDDAGDDGSSTYDIEPGTEGYAHQCDAEGDCTFINWRVANPSFAVFIDQQEVHGYEWELGVAVTLNIDDPGNGVGVDYTDTRTPEPAEWDASQTFVWFDPFASGGFEMFPDFDVQLTDGTTTKNHTITGLEVTDIDPDADTVSGLAAASSDVYVGIHDEFGAWRHEVALGGSWAADFSAPGDELPEEDATFDIVPGVSGDASQCDDDGDCTRIDWRVANPQFFVDPTTESIWGHDWAANTEITIAVNATPVPGGPYVTDEWGNFWTGFDPAELDIAAGDEVEVSDGIITKTHTVTHLTVGTIDPDTNVVDGTAAAGSDVWVDVHGSDAGRTVTAGPGWSTDFDDPGDHGGTFDIESGTEGYTAQCDAEGDCTWIDWRVANPQFFVDPTTESTWGHDWAANTEITITVDGAPVPGGPYVTDEWGNFWTGFDPAELDIAAGDEVEVSDGTITKTHTVTHLEVTSVDPDTNVVSGTAAADSEVFVDIEGFGEAGRWVTADGSGDWSTDFDEPGDGGGTVDIQPGTFGWAQQPDADGDWTQVTFYVANPHFNVDPTTEGIWGHDWLANTEITITVDGAPVPGDPIFTDEWGNFWTGFDPAELNLAPDGVVGVTDGVSTKDHTVTNLTVDFILPDTNVVSGEAGVLSDVWVDVHGSDAGRWAPADLLGNWSSDFDDAGEHGGTFDIEPGTEGYASQCDAEGDCTWIDWRVPNPQFFVDSSTERIWGGDWLPNTEMTITVNGGGVPGDPIFTDVWGNFGVGFDPAELDIWGDDEVVVSDGTTTKDHIVSFLEVRDIDVVENTVAGTESPTYHQVWVDVHGSDAGRSADVDQTFGTGTWSTDFDDPGAFGGTFDIEPGTEGYASQCDGDGDCTWIDWRVANPHFNVDPVHESIHGGDWLPNTEITITVNGAPVPGDSVFTGPEGWFGTGFDPAELDIGGGDEVVVSDGETTKSHFVIGTLSVGDVDPGTDTISGGAEADSEVHVNIHDADGVWRNEIATGGAWTADFSVPGDEGGEDQTWDIAGGTHGSASQCDDDGDCTQIDWRAADPRFSVLLTRNVHNPSLGIWWAVGEVHGYDWELGVPVTLSVDDPDNGPGVDYTDTRTPEPAEWDPEQSFVWFDPRSDGFGIWMGDEVELSNGEVTKTHTVTELELTDVNIGNDTVSGAAAADSDVDVNIHNEFGSWRHVVATGGFWTADFSVPGIEEGQEPFDIVRGTNGDANQCDEDGDCTQLWWRVNNPYIQVSLTRNWVQGWDFAPYQTVQIDIYDDLGGLLFSEERDTDENGTFYLDGGEHGEDLVPDYRVVVSDGSDSKELVLEDITFDTFEPATDDIGGMAPPGRVVGFGVGNDFDGIGDEVLSDGSGWGVNLMAQYGFDLLDDMGGMAWLTDDDGDQTAAEPLRPYIQGSITNDWLRGEDFTPNDAVAVEIFEFDGGGLLFSEIRATDPNGGWWLDWHEHGLELAAGMYIAVTGPAATKSLELVDLTFDVFDPVTDTLAGTAPAGTVVNVHGGNEFEGWNAFVEADPGGNWSVDVLGDHGVDLDYTMGAQADVADDDRDLTTAEPLIPYLDASLTSDYISGSGFGPTVVVEIFDGPGGTLLFESGPMPTSEGGHFFMPWFGHEVDLIPGLHVVATGSQKDVELATLTFHTLDAATDVAGGTAPPEAWVQVNGGDEFGGFEFEIQADPAGNWSFDILAETGYDVTPDTGAEARVYDAEGDSTHAEFFGEPPPIDPHVWPRVSHDMMWGGWFEPNDIVTVEIYGPGSTLLHTVTRPTSPQGFFLADWANLAFDLLPGQLIDARDTMGNFVVLEIADVTVDDFDPGSDEIGGTIEPFVDFTVFGETEFDGFEGDFVADDTGTWSVNVMTEFGFDLTPDSEAGIFVPVPGGVPDSRGGTVAHPAPFVLGGTDGVIGEGGTFATSGMFFDPAGDTSMAHTATVDYDDGSGAQPLALVGMTFDLNHSYADDGFYEALVCVTANQAVTGCDEVLVTVNNLPPELDVGADATISEGGLFSQGGSFTDLGADTWTATVDYGDGGGAVPLTLSGKTFTLSHTYADGSDHTVEVCVTDDDGGTGCDTLVVTVDNVAPVVSVGADATIDEGGLFSQGGSFTDPGADTWTATVDYGDGGGVEALTLMGTFFTVSHTYADGSTHTVEVCVTDDEAGVGCDQLVVTVNNVAPVVDAGPDATIAEGGTFTGAGSFTDPGADAWTATVDYDDGGAAVPLTLTGKTFALSHTYADGSTHTVEVCVTDDDGGTGCDQLVVTVNNVAPVVDVGPDASLEAGQTLTGSGSFTDPGADTWTATVDYDDGGAAVPLTLTGKTFALSHTYAAAGSYTLTVCVSDDDGGTGCDTRTVTVTEVAGKQLEAPTVGLVDSSQGLWHLRNSTGAVTSFFYGNPGDIPFMGDWDCDGVDTPGLFRQSDAFAYLRNSNSVGIADIRFFFGNPDDVPLAGDFNGDGCDTLSIYRPSEQRFYIMNELGENEGGLGAAEYAFTFGNPGDKPVVGDWDGDGLAEVGLHRESTGFFYYRNTLDTGIASAEFFFGDPGDRFVAGDWGVVDGVDTPAVFRPGNTTYYFRHTNSPGNADSEFVWGESSWLPVAGAFRLG